MAITITVAEAVGIAGFGLAVLLAVVRLFDRVRLSAETMKSHDYYGDSRQRDDNYEMLVTNTGSRATTITHIEVLPFVRSARVFRRMGVPSSFVTDEFGLSFVRLMPGETTKFDFPFHQLNIRVDAAGGKRVKADGHVCRIHHTAAYWPKYVLLG